MKELTFLLVTQMKLKVFSRNIVNSRIPTWHSANTMRKRTPSSLKTSWARMLTSRMNRKSSSKLRCKSLRSVWKTWKPFTRLMRRSLNSTMKYCMKEKELTRRWWKLCKTGEEEQRLRCLRWTSNSESNHQDSNSRTSGSLTNTSNSQLGSRTCRRSTRDLRSRTIIGLRRFGLWTTRKPEILLKRSCMPTRLSISNSSLSHGSPLLIHSFPSSLSQTRLQATQATKELIRPHKATLWWIKIHRSWTARVVPTKPRARVSLLVMTNQSSLVTPMTFVTSMRKSKMSSKCSSKSAHIWLMIRHLKSVKANRSSSSFQSKLIRSESLSALSRCRTLNFLSTRFTPIKLITMKNRGSNKINGTKKIKTRVFFLVKTLWMTQ